MAALNCPSCHHHGLVWDWNQSHMMSGGFGPQWGGLPNGTWHGSAMLPPYRPEGEMARRNSLRAPPRRSRRDLTTDDEDDLHHRRNASPARSRRGPISEDRISPTRSRRGLVSDDSEDEIMSHRGGRRHRRRTSPASPALSRRSSRKKSLGVEELIARRVKQNQEEALRSGRYDDETMSNRSSRRYEDDTTSVRGGRRFHDDDRLSIKSGRRQDMDETLSNRGSKRNEYDDSMSSRSQRFDDEIMSNRGGKRNDFDETLSIRGGRRLSDTNRRKRSSPTQLKKLLRNGSSEDSGDEMSDGIKSKSTTLTRQLKTGVSNGNQESNDEDVNIPKEVDEPLGPIPTQEWECDHCTFVNQAGTRVCIVCCKTTNSPKYKKQSSKPQLPHQNSKEKISQEITSQTRYQNSSVSPLKEIKSQEHMKMQETNTQEDTNTKPSVKEQSTKQSDLYDGDLSEKTKKQLTISPSPEKKKGKRRRTISFWLGTKLYS